MHLAVGYQKQMTVDFFIKIYYNTVYINKIQKL